MFGFFLDKGLVSANQSGFKAGNSCINQLLSITQYEVRDVFLDISKAFDKIWHDGLILKLGKYGISVNVLKVLKHIFGK